MTIIVQSSLASLVPVSQCPSFLPDFDQDHSDDFDDDNEDIQFWWDDYVTEFPAAYYTLTTPEDFNNLFSDDEEDKYKQVTKDKDEYNTTTEYVAVTEYEHNTKYDHNNNVKSVAMFHARRAVMFQARIAVTFQARSATRLTSLTTNLSLRQT